jgi:hypothetical protein
LLAFVEKEFGSLNVGMGTFYSQAALYDKFIHDIPNGGQGRRREYMWNLRYFRRVLPRLFAVSLRGQECRFHEQLASAVHPGDTFISFNYDCLLDRAVQKQARRRWNAISGYGFEVAAGHEDWNSHGGTGRFPQKSIRILKPHGSLNWKRGAAAGWELLSDEYCDRPDEELIFVPPLWQKSFDEEPYQTVWRETRGTLSKVKALFLIGYSLPETDVYTQATLRMDVGPLDFLCIVNPDREVRARIVRTLRSSVTTATHLVEFERLADFAGALPPPEV